MLLSFERENRIICIVMKTAVTGKILRDRRKRLGIDQRTLAEITKVSEHTIVNLEAERGNPTLRVLTAVLDALGLELVVRVRQPPFDTTETD